MIFKPENGGRFQNWVFQALRIVKPPIYPPDVQKQMDEQNAARDAEEKARHAKLMDDIKADLRQRDIIK